MNASDARAKVAAEPCGCVACDECSGSGLSDEWSEECEGCGGSGITETCDRCQLLTEMDHED